MAKNHDENYQDDDLENIDVDADTEDIDQEDTQDDTKDDAPTPEQELAELRKFKADKLKAEAIARRHAGKNRDGKPTKTNQVDSELAKDLAEFKFERKVSKFAEAHALSTAQAERVLKFKPDATAEDLKDPFIKAGIDALARKDRIERNTPRGKNSGSAATTKSLSEMTAAEKEAWYKDN